MFAGTAVDDAYAKSRVDPIAHVGNQRAVKRRDSRRHTLANGVDFNMVSGLRICGIYRFLSYVFSCHISMLWDKPG